MESVTWAGVEALWVKPVLPSTLRSLQVSSFSLHPSTKTLTP